MFRFTPLLLVAVIALTIGTAASSGSAPQAAVTAHAGNGTATAVPIGTPILLRGDGRELLEAVVEHVVDPVTSATPPSRGQRLVAVGLRLRNRGAAVYSGCPWLTSSLLDSRGREADWQLFGIEPSADCVKVRPGRSVFGYLTYAIARNRRPSSFVFSPQIFGGETGRWDLRHR